MDPLTPADLQAYLTAHDIQARLLQEPAWGDTATVPTAAIALGVEPEQIIKSLLFLIKPRGGQPGSPEPLLVISHGLQRVDRKAIAAHAGVGVKKVKLASAAAVLEVLGYPAGGVPPFGHRTAVPVIVDASLLASAERYGGRIFGGGGDDRTMLELSVTELLRVTRARVLAVS
ncbi:MAG: YbaK/EbsC family protein [Anaerolineae bacterium]